MLLLSRSQQQDADNILQTSSLSWPGKKKKNPENEGPEAHHEQPTIHKSTFWECGVAPGFSLGVKEGK